MSRWEALPGGSADCFDGSIQGSYMDNNMRTELCVQALENACRNTDIEGRSFTPTGAASLPARCSSRPSGVTSSSRA